MSRRGRKTTLTKGVRKSPAGIKGLDEITGEWLPPGRPTLVSGNAGCGKTVPAVELLVRGATLYGEPGIFVTFDETADELADNVAFTPVALDHKASTARISSGIPRLDAMLGGKGFYRGRSVRVSGTGGTDKASLAARRRPRLNRRRT
jgi:KaiC/GvpD/RAD55 family RecA-like ATPase